jgi:hypothetical protein
MHINEMFITKGCAFNDVVLIMFLTGIEFFVVLTRVMVVITVVFAMKFQRENVGCDIFTICKKVISTYQCTYLLCSLQYLRISTTLSISFSGRSELEDPGIGSGAWYTVSTVTLSLALLLSLFSMVFLFCIF